MPQDERTLPIARRDQLLVEELPGELVVYDLRTHHVHCLNLPAARAWELCDGKHLRADLAAALQHEFNLPPDEEVVELALASLQKAALLSTPIPSSAHAGVSRRAVVRRLALAAGVAALLPSVKSAQAAVRSFLGSCAPSTICGSGVSDCHPCYIPTPAPPGAHAKQCEDRRCWQGNCRLKADTDCA